MKNIKSLFLRILTITVTLLVSMFLAKTLGPADFGLYTFAFAALAIIGVPVQMGLPILVLRVVSQAYAKCNYGIIKGIIQWANIRVTFSCFLIAVIGVGLFFLDGVAIYGLQYEIGNQLYLIIIGSPMVAFVALGRVRGGVLRGLGHPIAGQLPEDVLRPCIFLLVAIFVYVINSNLTKEQAIGIQVLSSMGAFIFGALMLKKYAPAEINKSIKETEVEKWSKSLWLLGFISGLQILNQSADVLILGFAIDSEAIGIYKISATAAGMVSIGIKVVSMNYAQKISSIYAAGDIKKLQSCINSGNRACFFVAFPVIFSLVFAGDKIITILYGESYANGYPVMIVIIVGQMVNMYFGMTQNIIAMIGEERYALKILSIGSIAGLFLQIILVPFYGYWASAALSSIVNIFNAYLLYKFLKIRINIDSSYYPLMRNFYEKYN